MEDERGMRGGGRAVNFVSTQAYTLYGTGLFFLINVGAN